MHHPTVAPPILSSVPVATAPILTVITVAFVPDDPAHLADIEVIGEETLSPAQFLHIVESAAMRLTAYAADFRLAVLLDRILDANATPSMSMKDRASSGALCRGRRPHAMAKQAAHLGEGAKQDKGC